MTPNLSKAAGRLKNVEAVYPLSPMQEGMLFHWIEAPKSGVYLEQFTCELAGPLEVEAFHRAWCYVVERHAILRTGFAWKKVHRMLQVVHRHVELPFIFEDWEALPPSGREAKLEEFLKAERERGFDLSRPPLMRIALFRVDAGTLRFVWTHHHLLLDGWSLPILISEVLESYAAFAAGTTPRLDPVRPFHDYIDWLQGQDLYRAEQFWRGSLRGFDTPTPILPGCRETVDSERHVPHKRETLLCDPEMQQGLARLCHRLHVTPANIIQAAWGILLSKYSGEREVVFGVTVSGRPPDLAGSDRMVGVFINTLPLRVSLSETDRLSEVLARTHRSDADIQQYAYAPLYQVSLWSDIPRGAPLFHSIVVVENYPYAPAVRSRIQDHVRGGIRTSGQTNYPLTIVAIWRESLQLDVVYDPSAFSEATIHAMLCHLRNILDECSRGPDRLIADLEMLTADEHASVLDGPSIAKAGEKGGGPLVVDVFREMAAQQPDAQAVVCDGRSVTYGEMEKRAAALALHLRCGAVGPEQVVAVYLDRSADMVAAILGIMGSGAAFLPMEAGSPAGRVAYILQDSGARLVVTRSDFLSDVEGSGIPVLCLDQLLQGGIEVPLLPAQSAGPDNAAYVIYTSGSTGRPKGVVLDHGGLANRMQAMMTGWHVMKGSRILQFASPSFDASVAEIFLALCSGGTIVMVGRDTVYSPDALAETIRENAVTHVTLPPSILAALPAEGYPLLKVICAVADVCPWGVAERWGLRHAFFNGYGPTEATICVTTHHFEGTVPGSRTLPIGRPLSGVCAYVLDWLHKPVPVGVPGELHIGGHGLSRGYIHRPDLTADRFIPDPFSSVAGARMYRTGDRVRVLPSGSIEFIGRVDHQIKIRGIRIEPAEIETALLTHPSVLEAAVLAEESGRGEKRLVAVIQLRETSPVTVAELLEYLRTTIPEGMLPSRIVTLNKIPRTTSGKIDRQALPGCIGSQPETRGDRHLPTPAAEILAGIWASVLGVQAVGPDDDFFELGGHSLRATQVLSRVREAFGVELPVQAVFRHRTLSSFASAVERKLHDTSSVSLPAIVPVERSGEEPLSFTQERLWFLEQLEPGSALYSIPLAVRATGPLDLAALQHSLNAIVRRHEILRARFRSAVGKPAMVISPEQEVAINFIDLSGTVAEQRDAGLRAILREHTERPFDLQRDPLLRIAVVRLGGDDHVLFMAMHHIISDGWSMGILMKELTSFYAAYRSGQSGQLDPLPIQYVDYAHWQRRVLQGEFLDHLIAYWKGVLTGIPPALEIPTDKPRPRALTFEGGTVSADISPELSTALTEFSHREGVTPFMVLLAVFHLLLHRYSGQSTIVVGTPVAHRTEGATENLIGFFVNTLPLRLDFRPGATFTDILHQVREVCLGAFAHQHLPYEKIVEYVQPARDLSRSPIFQAAFVFQNAFTEVSTIPDLVMEPMEMGTRTAKYELTLTIAPLREGMTAVLEYNTGIFERKTVDALLRHYMGLVTGVITGPGEVVSRMRMVTDEEERMMLGDWNATSVAYPDNTSVHRLFERVVADQPDAPAVRSGGVDISYREINRRANRLARYLCRLGVSADRTAGICTERVPDMIVAVLATLKAGGAFLPLDPSYPAGRLAYMCDDARITVLVTQEPLLDRFAGVQVRAVCLDKEKEEFLREDDGNLGETVFPENLAYVIFTSGSTGRPKGTMLHHRGLCNLAAAQTAAFRVGPGSRVLQFSSLSFDAAVWEMVMALLSGATIVLERRDTLSTGQGIRDTLLRERITVITIPPSVLSVVPPGTFPELRTVITAGERCTGDLVSLWAEGREFFNAYGPTETTVCASLHKCAGTYMSGPPIGRPLRNFHLYILDEAGMPVPPGVLGELYVAGVGLARGYLGRPDLTAERFVPNPFGEAGSRLYRSGDICKFRTDGEVEFLGRVDEQVKVRGFRIELGEIASVLKGHVCVSDAAVVVREDRPGDPRIVAYIVPKTGTAVTIHELRAHLRVALPEYMVPSLLVMLDAMPLTSSGKVDHRALPAPEQERPDAESSYVPPRNVTESQLAQICAEVLGIRRVGIHDNFFELGGHSLLATQFLARAGLAFNIDLPVRSLFEHPTIAELSGIVDAASIQGGNNLAVIADVLEQVELMSEAEAEQKLSGLQEIRKQES